MKNHTVTSLFIALSTCAVLPIAAAQSNRVPLAKPPRPIAAEKNPPGDILDNQAFVTFKSPLGFSVKVPEGWARRDEPSAVRFSDKYNTLRVAVSPRPAAPTVANLKTNEVAALAKLPKAIRIHDLQPLSLPAGSAVVVTYDANSDPNPVTNKAIRLENANYYFWKAGHLATLTLSAPAGADNADQWRVMARSFTWQ
ncbi:MAG: hypothetical protein ABI478_04240 [Propionivibrio sp.]